MDLFLNYLELWLVKTAGFLRETVLEYLRLDGVGVAVVDPLMPADDYDLHD